MSKIQDEFDAKSGDFQLAPGEYEGPLIVRRPCVIDGGMSTLWAEKGPVLTVDAAGVTVKNLRVEVTGALNGPKTSVAVQTNYLDTILEGVEARGKIFGFADEDGTLEIPTVISLGDFAAGVINTFSVEFTVPTEAEIYTNVKDISIAPTRLQKGKNRILLQTDEIRNNTILYGEIMVKTLVSRRVYLTGKAVEGAPEYHELPLISDENLISQSLQIEIPDELIAPMVPDAPVEFIRRGQRIPVEDLQSSVIKIAYAHRDASEDIEIDGYAFLLKSDGKVRGDDGLIFFGNPESGNQEVRVGTWEERPIVFVELQKAESWLDKIAVCLSIYGDLESQNFSIVDDPVIRIFSDETELYRFELSDIRVEKTIVALEIYRYKGAWKMNFVGSGYRSGLKELCESYGVEVE